MLESKIKLLKDTFFIIHLTVQSIKVLQTQLFLKLKCHMREGDQKSVTLYLNGPLQRSGLRFVFQFEGRRAI